MQRYKSKTVKDTDIQKFFSRLKEDFLTDLRAGRDVHYRYYLCFAILAGSGLRASEVLSLKFENLYIETFGKTDLVILSVLGKGSKTRDVLLPPRLSNLLFDYEAYCLKNYFRSEAVKNGSYLIFKTSGGLYAGPYTYKWLYKTLKELLDRYNLVFFSPHKFRHTYASKIANLDTLVASQQLGHSKMDTTKIYLHQVNSDLLLKSVKTIDEVFDY